MPGEQTFQEYEVRSGVWSDEDELSMAHSDFVEYEVRPEGWSSAMSAPLEKGDISVAGFEVEFLNTVDLMPVDLINVRQEKTS